jgi:mannose-6-phosphate isomerase
LAFTIPGEGNHVGPLKFRPILKRTVWGGRRLGELLGKPIGPESDYGESWEICDRGPDQSVVMEGPWRDWNLQRLVQERAHDLLGRHAGIPQFPLLIKFLDARDRLSVQVHPDDARASRYAPLERGKSEAWVVLAAGPQSCVYSGLNPGIDEPVLRAALAAGTIERCLHRVPVAEGDCLYLPAGTVHAIGEGTLLAEVQQSSDLTFRLFDWNRMGGDGRPRRLHISEALDCIDFRRGPVHRLRPTIDHDAGPNCELLVKCPSFAIHRHHLTARLVIPDDTRSHIIVGLSGSTNCRTCDGSQQVALGDSVLLPASSLPAEFDQNPASIILDVFWE